MALDDEALYVSTADGEVVALRAQHGRGALAPEAYCCIAGCRHRRVMDDAIVLGDFQGYVHWLDKASGAIAARVHAGKARISAPAGGGRQLVVVSQLTAARSTPTA